METVKVIVTKCDRPSYWYANSIGNIFECYQRGNHFQVVENEIVIYYMPTRFIQSEDCIPYDYISRKPIKKLKLI